MPTSSNDPDDAPDLSTPEWRAKFAAAPLRQGLKIVRRGRPALAKPKQAVSLRLDAEVIAYFKADGPGWQTRINQRLRLVAMAAGEGTKGRRCQKPPEGEEASLTPALSEAAPARSRLICAREYYLLMTLSPRVMSILPCFLIYSISRQHGCLR